jgi:chromosome partitioning protein
VFHVKRRVKLDLQPLSGQDGRRGSSGRLVVSKRAFQHTPLDGMSVIGRRRNTRRASHDPFDQKDDVPSATSIPDVVDDAPELVENGSLDIGHGTDDETDDVREPLMVAKTVVTPPPPSESVAPDSPDDAVEDPSVRDDAVEDDTVRDDAVGATVESPPPAPLAPPSDPPVGRTEPSVQLVEAAVMDPAADGSPTDEVVGESPVIATPEPSPPIADPAGVEDQRSVRARRDREPVTMESLPEGPTSPRELPRIMAVANQKGGVGKTTTTVNLGAALAEMGYRVLVIDLDPQGNATTGLGVDARNFETSMYDVIMRETPLEDCIEPTSVRNLFVAPATIDLAGVEIELVPAFSRELRLRRAVEGIVDDFDFVLIDCPPSLGLITINGLAAASEVLVPIQCEYYALEGLGQLLRNVHLVASNLNPTLEVSTIVLTMYDARTRLAVDVATEVRKHFSGRVCRSVIPRTIRLSEAPSFGQPITVFDPSSRGAVAYRELAKEVSAGAAKRAG